MSSKAQAAVKVPAQLQQTQNLYYVVETYDTDGKQLDPGKRIVDLYHYGTRNWYHNHTWWALHHACTLDVRPADDNEVAEYVREQEIKLMEKFAKAAA